MEENTAVAVEVPDHVAALVSVLGFAHAAVQNDAAWAAVYDKIAADHAEDPDPDDKPAESGVLREVIHTAVDLVMAATENAVRQQALGQIRAQLGSPQGEPPAVEAPPYDGGGMYL